MAHSVKNGCRKLEFLTLYALLCALCPMPFAFQVGRGTRMQSKFRTDFFNKPNFKENIDMRFFSVYKGVYLG